MLQTSVLKNRWTAGLLATDNITGKPSLTTTDSEATNWVLEPAAKEWVRLRSVAVDGYLHAEGGNLQTGPIQLNWLSAVWQLEAVSAGFVRLRNGEQTDFYLHNESGVLALGAVEPGWWSAMWTSLPGTGVSAATLSGLSSQTAQSAANGSAVSGVWPSAPVQQAPQVQAAPPAQAAGPAFAPQSAPAPAASQGQTNSDALAGYFDPTAGASPPASAPSPSPGFANQPGFANRAGAAQNPAATPEPAVNTKKVVGKWWRDAGNFTKKEITKVEGLTAGGGDIGAHTSDYNAPEVYVITSLDDQGKRFKMQRDTQIGRSTTYSTQDGVSFTAENASGSAERTFALIQSRSGQDRIRLGSGVILDPALVPDHLELADNERRRAAGMDVPEKESMSSAFNMGNNAYSIEYNFIGYDLSQIDPWDFTRKHTSKEVFARPFGSNWHPGNQTLVPYGLREETRSRSGTAYSENAVVNSNEYQKTVRHTAGGSIGVPKAGSVGVKTVNENTKGMRNGSDEMMAFGVARHHKVAYILDRANMKLSDYFIDAVYDLKSRRMPVDRFITEFGTHYPHAITYGAMGKLQLTFNNEQFAEWKSKKKEVSVEAKAEIKKVEVAGNYGKSTETSERAETGASMKMEKFQSVGANGSWGKDGYTASESKPAPILMDLRPLHELLSPAFFPDDNEVQTTVRLNLKNGIEAYLAQKANELIKFDNTPKVMRITVGKLRCISDGGESGNTAEYYGGLTLDISAGSQSHRKVLFSRTEDQVVEIECGGSDSSPVANHQKLLAMTTAELNSAYLSISSQLIESDTGRIDPDEPMPGVTSSTRLIHFTQGTKTMVYEWWDEDKANRASVEVSYEVLN